MTEPHYSAGPGPAAERECKEWKGLVVGEVWDVGLTWWLVKCWECRVLRGETYADLVFSLKSEFPDFPDASGGKPVTFRSALERSTVWDGVKQNARSPVMTCSSDRQAHFLFACSQ